MSRNYKILIFCNLADPIVIEHGTFAWEPETVVLRDINLRIKAGSLVAVVGSVGSGIMHTKKAFHSLFGFGWKIITDRYLTFYR